MVSGAAIWWSGNRSGDSNSETASAAMVIIGSTMVIYCKSETNVGGVIIFRGGFCFCGKFRHSIWDKSRSLFWFLCYQRCFLKNTKCSARLHCQQPIWAWENYSEELKHPPPFFCLFAGKFWKSFIFSFRAFSPLGNVLTGSVSGKWGFLVCGRLKKAPLSAIFITKQYTGGFKTCGTFANAALS